MSLLHRIGFRQRLLLFLLSFAVLPGAVISLAWVATERWSLRLVGNSAAWDTVATSGTRAIELARRARPDAATAAALADHESKLRQSIVGSQRLAYVARRLEMLFVVAMLVSMALLAFLGWQAAGHLSRSLSRPLHEIVGWTELIARGDPLPEGRPRRGAPEFDILRRRMRRLAAELRLGRDRSLEAERASAMRESARQVAHELKNPLTPIRFAVDRLRREAPPALAETVHVLAVESERLEAIARDFAQFGRLPEGPTAAIDLNELARYTARSVIPPGIAVVLELPGQSVFAEARYDALSRALANVALNAVDACAATDGATITLAVGATRLRGQRAVEIRVHDTGCGISADALSRIWDPYVTTKPGGTGLGLAIVRQTILAHDGAVEARSEPGAGTTIRLVLPAAANAAEPAAAPTPTGAAVA